MYKTSWTCGIEHAATIKIFLKIRYYMEIRQVFGKVYWSVNKLELVRVIDLRGGRYREGGRGSTSTRAVFYLLFFTIMFEEEFSCAFVIQLVWLIAEKNIYPDLLKGVEKIIFIFCVVLILVVCKYIYIPEISPSPKMIKYHYYLPPPQKKINK